MTKLDWNNFEPLFGTWSHKIKPFFDSGGFDTIYDFLKTESKRGKRIAPLSSNTFRCFTETDYNDVKVIFLGMCPYHTFKNGYPVADGLFLGCSITGIPQPSLIQFYEGIEKELYDGLDLNIIQSPDVSYLSKQGVLMLNAALTTEYNKAGSHLKIWEPFMIYLFENVFDTLGVPIVFFGKEAAKYKKYVPIFAWNFSVSHPASAAYKYEQWDSEGIFKKINKILKDTHNVTINWVKVNE